MAPSAYHPPRAGPVCVHCGKDLVPVEGGIGWRTTETDMSVDRIACRAQPDVKYAVHTPWSECERVADNWKSGDRR